MTRPIALVVNTNGGDRLLRCLEALHRQTVPAAVVVVDHCSTDRSPEQARAGFPDIRVIAKDVNAGYGPAANFGAARADGDPIVVLNEDVVLEPDWLAVVVGLLEREPEVGIVGGTLFFAEGEVQHAGGFLHRPLMLADHYHYRRPADELPDRARDVEYVTGAAMAVRRDVFTQLGGFDELFPAYFEETDLCARARSAGWVVRYAPAARGTHLESANYVRNSARYYRLYHLGRIRYALKHLTPAQFLTELVPAERARLPNVVSLDELAGLRHAFADHAAQLSGPSDDGLAPAQPELRPALADVLADLAQRALATTPTGAPAAARSDGLRSRARVEPRPFHSAAPLVGGTIARFRGAWNWMSTRWYVAPMVEQQNGFNAEVAGAVERIEARLDALERRAELQAGWLAEIDRDLVALARRAELGRRR